MCKSHGPNSIESHIRKARSGEREGGESVNKQNPTLITPGEMAKVLGKQNPNTIKAALRRGDYPIGMAYKGPGGQWVYDVPREAFMTFARTGRVPDYP